jgi:hypothetical protein
MLGKKVLAVDILKASPWVNAVNDVLITSGLKIVVPAKSTIQMFAAHAGASPIDFEVQGVIFYKPAAKGVDTSAPPPAVS